MSKITLTDLVNLQNETTAVNAINANNAVIETAMTNTLSRDGTAPNQMQAPLDMNSNRIMNVAAHVDNNDVARYQDIIDALDDVDPTILAETIAEAEAILAATVVTAQGLIDQINAYTPSPSVAPYGLPASMSWLPFDRYFVDGYGTASSNYDVLDYYTTAEGFPSAPVYVSYTNGLDTNSGASPSAPYKTLAKAANDHTTSCIFMMDKTHYSIVDVAFNSSHNNAIKSYSNDPVKVRFANDPALLTWVSDSGGGFPIVYKVNTINVGRVFDMNFSDAKGDYLEYSPQTSVANVNSNLGSWYWDGTTLFVRQVDSQAPTTNLLVTNLHTFTVSDNSALYTENIYFEGGGGVNVTAANAHIPRMYMNKSGVSYSANNSVAAAGGNLYTQSCVFHHPGLDNLNYAASAGLNCKFIENNIVCRDSSSTSTLSNNASTSHDSSLGFRFNGEYYNCNGPVVADSASAITYNVCTLAYRANVGGTAQVPSNYFLGGGTGTQYLHKPKSRLSTYDFAVDSGGSILVYDSFCNNVYSASGAGSIKSFTPTQPAGFALVPYN